MGLLSFFSKSEDSSLQRLPQGSFTVDKDGKIVSSTLPSTFPQKHLKDIADITLAIFRESAATNSPIREFAATYPALKVTARELRGGAMIFLSPRGLSVKRT